jgi:Transposase DDE domain
MRPEVECIGKGKVHKPYEFGVKASVATTLKHSKGGQLIVHARTLPGKPYDGHTLGVIIPEIERLVGAPLNRILADRGYRGHSVPRTHRFKVYISGQKRHITENIKRALRRRAAVEPVIGHMKAEHRMGRNYLAHATGDAINAVLAAVGYNFRRLLAWLAFLLSALILAIANQNLPSQTYCRLNLNLHRRPSTSPNFTSATRSSPLLQPFLPVLAMTTFLALPTVPQHPRHFCSSPQVISQIPKSSIACAD